MYEVAALAPGREIPVAVQAGIVLPMAGRQDRHRQPGARQGFDSGLAAQAPPTDGAPVPGLGVESGALIEADDHSAVRTPAGLAAPTGAAEANHRGELRPVDRVEVAVFGADRHDTATLARPG